MTQEVYSSPPHRLRHGQVINDDITVNFLHHFPTVHFLLVFWLHTTAHTVHTVLHFVVFMATIKTLRFDHMKYFKFGFSGSYLLKNKVLCCTL
jgi:hypothetical protein